MEGGAPAGDRGSATLAIGDESWEFASFSCAFGHDATRSDTFSFSSDARGEHSTGARVQMQANITDGDGRYEGAGVDYEVYIADIQDFTNPAVKWSSPSDFRLAPRETVIRIDGDNLTAEGNFDDGADRRRLRSSARHPHRSLRAPEHPLRPSYRPSSA